jgi:hypothetical protein
MFKAHGGAPTTIARKPAGKPDGGQFTPSPTTQGLHDRSNYTNPYRPADTPAPLSSNWRDHKFAPEAPERENLPEFELATLEEARDALETQGPLVCRRLLRDNWERYHAKFLTAVQNGNADQAAFYAETIRAVNRTAKTLFPR